MNLIIILLFPILVFGQSLPLDDKPELRFQRDLYIQKNKCDQKIISRLNAIHFRFRLDKKITAKPIIIQVNEASMQMKQTLFYTGEYFFYPGLFGQDGHKEYELPVCNSKDKCDFQFFVFDDANAAQKIVQKKSLDFDLSIFDLRIPNKKLFGTTISSTNHFGDDTKNKIFEDLNLKFNDDYSEIFATIDKEKLLKLLRLKYRIEMIFSYRKNLNQHQYSEESVNLKLDNPWFAHSKNNWYLKEKLTKPTYLSFMVLVSDGPESYESKIEVHNAKNPFYQCH